jgi:hypothetical protein
MNDKELLDSIEARVFYAMFDGCVVDDHLDQRIDTGSWSVSLRADTLCRLLDMAKGNVVWK